MKLTAADLKDLGIIEKIIPEPEHYTAENMEAVCSNLEKEIRIFLEQYGRMGEQKLTENRYQRFRRM